MLIYTQKKFSEQGEKTQIPDYWKECIKTINEANAQERAYYASLENQLDLIIQDEALFTIDPESHFVKYVDDVTAEQAGIPVRVQFTDTVASVRKQISDQIGCTEFTLFEVDRIRSGNCQLLKTLSMPDETLVKDSKITHQSTWMVVKNPELASLLLPHLGENSKPITLRVSKTELK